MATKKTNAKKQWQFAVIDRLTSSIVYRTRPYSDYQTAHKQAEKRARSLRFDIVEI